MPARAPDDWLVLVLRFLTLDMAEFVVHQRFKLLIVELVRLAVVRCKPDAVVGA